MKKKYQFKSSRREFIKKSTITASIFTIVPRYVLGGKGFIAPSSKLNIACVGVGGKGRTDAENVKNENIIALCDVDQVRSREIGTYLEHAYGDHAKHAWDAFPKARRYEDFREMLEKEKDIDAVMVSTPDHTHAVITMEALKKGKHVYTQKPLTHNVSEARKLTEFARKAGVATQMGNQWHAGEGPRILNELIWQGAIGRVEEVNCWTTHPFWPQGIEQRLLIQKVPSTLNWDLWLGPASYRDFNEGYLPIKWRGWWDFGGGALADMGCHIMDYPFWALKLTAPLSIEAYSSPVYEETAPLASLVSYKFKSGLDESIVKVTWSDGGLMPNMPEGMENLWGEIKSLNGGTIFQGESGVIVYGHKWPKPVLLVNGKKKNYATPKEMIPRSVGHYKEWLNECKGNGPRCISNFDYAGPLAEAVLLGTVAIRTGKKLLWNSENMKITNVLEANKYILPEYRQGWAL